MVIIIYRHELIVGDDPPATRGCHSLIKNYKRLLIEWAKEEEVFGIRISSSTVGEQTRLILSTWSLPAKMPERFNVNN